MAITWADITARRMHRQHLTAAASDVEAAAVAMAAAHAQVHSAAELSIGIRTDGTTRADVRAAIAEGTLTKTIGPRGTVHLLATRDLGLWLGALDDVPVSIGLPAASRLSDGQLEEVIGAIAVALDGADLTADELDDLVVAATGPWAADPVVPAFGGWWPRWRQAIARAASAGVLAYGAGRGSKATYTRPPAFTVPPDPAAALLHEYLHSYGPATHREFAQWLAAPLRWSAAVFERAEVEPVEVEPVEVEPAEMEQGAIKQGAIDAGAVEGETRWVNRGDTGFTDAPAEGIRLLPYFDPYAVGSHPRTVVFPGRAADRALGRGQAGVFPVLLVDGVVGGVWHLKRSGKRIAVTVEPLGSLGAQQKAQLKECADRVGSILEGQTTLAVGEISVGPHA